jgi:L-ribulose-5-phosphate 3-epimerase
MTGYAHARDRKGDCLIKLGINGRFFPNNWRSAIEEINFCERHSFRSLQFQGKEHGLNDEDLGAPLSEIATQLQATSIIPVMEILIRLDANGMSSQGKTPIQILHTNLNAIRTLRCEAVHWHLVAPPTLDDESVQQLEINLQSQLGEAVQLAKETGFCFGIEHNEPEQKLFNNPLACSNALEAVPGLCFVWDFNHTALNQIADYKKLIPRISLLHISDSPLPATNHHLPIGLGNINFEDYFCTLLAEGFDGAAILEIGGLPKSGGYNRDTDAALVASQAHLHQLIQSCS